MSSKIAMEQVLRDALGVSDVEKTNIVCGGCINSGSVYKTSTGFYFVKQNTDKAKADIMFKGEYEGLKKIMATKTVRVPKPFGLIKDNTGSSALVLEYVKMSSLSKYDDMLGEMLAKLHLHNKKLGQQDSKIKKRSHDDDKPTIEFVEKFGFHTKTCCGHIPLENTWKDNWVEFFAQQRIDLQIKLIENKTGARELRELWSLLQKKLPSYFKNVSVYPALLHGDLWNGNAAETKDGPVIYDPASFYGHSEFDLSIANMFGGFSHAFFDSYHRLIPKEPGYSDRLNLYRVFHYLNHWNHFGGSYKETTLSLMEKMVK